MPTNVESIFMKSKKAPGNCYKLVVKIMHRLPWTTWKGRDHSSMISSYLSNSKFLLDAEDVRNEIDVNTGYHRVRY